jgi:hypothetical protein
VLDSEQTSTLDVEDTRDVETDLRAIKSALAKTASMELRALVSATTDAPETASGLLSWIDTACEWELNRRDGHYYELQPPEAIIPPEQDAVSVDAAIAMRATFVLIDPFETGAVLAFFEALANLLTGAGQQKH